jgi:hypothetical protein
MKKHLIALFLLAGMILSISSVGQQGNPAKTALPEKVVGPALQTFTGVISDGQCAAKGSHDEIMKKASVNTAANCTRGCARRHGYVLYNAASKKIYKLSDQERPAEFADQQVKIKGRLDKNTNTIQVSSIEPAR